MSTLATRSPCASNVALARAHALCRSPSTSVSHLASRRTRPAEILRKAERYLVARQVVVSGEHLIWPREMRYLGRPIEEAYTSAPLTRRAAKPSDSPSYHWRSNTSSAGEIAPPASSLPASPPDRSASVDFANVGAVMGRAGDLHRLLTCMGKRYGYPETCPLRIEPGGNWYNASSDAKVRWRYGVLTGSWGWEQACWHMYLVERRLKSGVLPAGCPELIVDRGGELFITLMKTIHRVAWGANGRVRFSNAAGSPSRPCVAHAAGSIKAILPAMGAWWDHTAGAAQLVRPGPRLGKEAIQSNKTHIQTRHHMLRYADLLRLNASSGYVRNSDVDVALGLFERWVRPWMARSVVV